MSKWINDRAWTVSMYICYALCFIILCVAGYNFTMGIIGETSSIMKVVLLICIILFVGFGVSMVFSIFITPLSENWLNNYPGYTDARRLFPHEDAIKGTKSNYSNANNEKNCSKEIMETINKLLEDKLKEMIDKSETQQN